jgi:hypothetical protein
MLVILMTVTSMANGIEEIRHIIVTATPSRLVDLLGGVKSNPNTIRDHFVVYILITLLKAFCVLKIFVANPN